MFFRLKVFVAVATHFNYTKAARELQISQPAVTKHIQELESIYKVQLFERGGNGTTLTIAGEAFFKHAVKIIEACEALVSEMKQMSSQEDYADCIEFFISSNSGKPGKRKK